MTPNPSRAVEARERQAFESLERAGLQAGPRRLTRGLDRRRVRDGFYRRLRRAATELGGGFALYGRYLAGRADLIDTADCLELARIPDRASPSSPDAVSQRLESALGQPLDGLFPTFEPEPFESGIFFQTHRAWTREGQAVEVRIEHPDFRAELEQDLEVLPGWLERLSIWSPHPMAPIEDFARDVEHRSDLGRTAEALRDLAAPGAVPHGVAAPQTHSELSGAGILTLDHPGGSRAAEGQPVAADCPESARHLAGCWLHLALAGRWFPVAGELTRCADGQLTLARAGFARARGASQANLWTYLKAAAEHDSRLAFESLAREIEVHPAATSAGLLEKRMRQAVPLHDGLLSKSGESVAEHLMLHWRLTRDCGLQVPPHLAEFFRGALWLAVRIQPSGDTGDRDALRDALDDRRLFDDWSRVERLSDPLEMVALAERYMASMTALPHHVDRLLERAPEEAAPGPAAGPRTGADTGRNDTGLAVVAIAMAALALSAPRLAEFFPHTDTNRVVVPIFLILGALLLRAIGRRR